MELSPKVVLTTFGKRYEAYENNSIFSLNYVKEVKSFGRPQNLKLATTTLIFYNKHLIYIFSFQTITIETKQGSPVHNIPSTD